MTSRFYLTEADMKFCGIDLHLNNSVVVVSDTEDRIVLQRRLPNALEAILAALAPHRGELEGVVVESTYNWCWLVDGPMDVGYQVHLAHVAAIKRYEGPARSRWRRSRTSLPVTPVRGHAAPRSSE
ncbi:hypothetical protein [Paraburkholderia phytofirmans]|uniref:hypothetical protein n=1 Tax=Paraburkholderia phytofirmans TaxID=261302 RepID=UPI001F373060|nr:hypothetical protein [Paraburkholderia phytofirmans]